MADGLMRGVAVYHDGTEHPYTIGASEQIKAARRYPDIALADLDKSSMAIEFIAFLIFESLKRQGDVSNVGFDTWCEGLADPGVSGDAEGESPAPRTD
jgi:hypothetical protein